MKFLLDTHVLLWWLDNPALLAIDEQSAIADPANQILLSAVSVWEISLKQSLGKLTTRGDIEIAISKTGFTSLPLTITHAWALRSLPAIHRDPFDRMLIAQAIVEGATIITHDAEIRRYQVNCF